MPQQLLTNRARNILFQDGGKLLVFDGEDPPRECCCCPGGYSSGDRIVCCDFGDRTVGDPLHVVITGSGDCDCLDITTDWPAATPPENETAQHWEGPWEEGDTGNCGESKFETGFLECDVNGEMHEHTPTPGPGYYTLLSFIGVDPSFLLIPMTILSCNPLHLVGSAPWHPVADLDPTLECDGDIFVEITE